MQKHLQKKNLVPQLTLRQLLAADMKEALGKNWDVDNDDSLVNDYDTLLLQDSLVNDTITKNSRRLQ